MTERDKQAAKPATRTGDRRHQEAASSRGAGPRADELAQLLETMADWLWETDVEHRFVWLSEHFAERTGYDPARVIGKSRRDLLAVEASQDVEQHLADMEAHRPFRDFVYHSAVMPQQCSWISVSGYPLFDGDGAFLGYRGGARNVTGVVQAFQALDQARDELQERERREAQLLDAAKAGESNAERLMAALNVIEDAVCYYDADDRLILYNEAFLTLYSGMAGAIHIGASFEELLDEGIKSRFFDTDGVSAEEWRSGALAKRRREQQAQHVLRLNDGRWLMRRLMRTADGGVIEICTDVSELKQRERALSDANAQASELLADLQRTVDAMRMGVVVVNGAMHAEIINKAFYDIWKVTPGDVSVGSPFRKLMDVNRHNGIYDIPDERWESYVEGRLDEIRAGPVAPREFRRADGLTMIYSVTELSGGKRLITYYDVSEIKNREKELATALERAGLADAVLNAVEDPIFVKDAELRYVFANEAFATHFGTKPAEMIGKTASHFATPAEAGRFELSERRVVASGVAFEAEEDFQANGATRTRIVRKSRVRMASGKDYVAGFLFDITDTKRREIEADEARHRLESVIESMPAGVIIYDRSNRYVLGNRLVKETLPALADAMQPGVPLRVALETAQAAG